MTGYVPMLRCVDCLTPVMILTPEQAAARRADPGRFRYVCVECERVEYDADGD